jgi:hypothetical protein
MERLRRVVVEDRCGTVEDRGGDGVPGDHRPGRGRGVSGALGGVGGGLPEAVGVVAAHPASGHVRRGPEGGSRVVGEAGRLLVALLGLTSEVAREGQVRKGQGQVARLRLRFPENTASFVPWL